MKSTNSLNNGKPTIAVLIGSMSSSYQEGIMRGAAAAAKEKDYNIIGFSGGPFNSPDPLAQSRETLFDLVDTSFIDGVIVPISSHSRYLNEAETQAFINRYKDIPLVNIGSIIPGQTNIMADYNTGLRDMIIHFVKDHGYKNIALFRGPSQHASSNIRETIYRQNLASLGLKVNESLIVYGDLRKNSAKAAVTELLDRRQQACDAIICVNDNLALGVIEALKERNINIPKDIALCGSLDNPAGSFSEPPLATIIEPLFELGYEAVQEIRRLFNNNDTPKNILIPTEMIKRQSCGCLITAKLKPESFEIIKAKSYESYVSELQDIYLACLEQAQKIVKKYRCSKNCHYVDIIMPIFYENILISDFTLFFSKLRLQLAKVLKTPDIIPWMQLLTNFEYTIVELFRITDDTIALENFLETLSLLKDVTTVNAIIFQNSETDFYINFSREIVNNLNSSFDLNAVRTYAVELLDLTDLYISVYDKHSQDLTRATNVMAVRDKTSIVIPKNETNFEAKLLMPQSVDLYKNRYNLMVFPLSFRKKPLGFLVLNLSHRKGSAYENMQAIISTALKNELQIQELKDAEARFSDIAHSTSDWLWETDINHVFTYSSISVKDAIGYTSAEIIGQSINKNTVEEWVSFYVSMDNQETLVNIETWFTHKNGSLVCLLISCAPITKESIFIGYRGVFKDITAQKLQEDKIKNLAYYDILTGLPNRTFFQEKLKSTVVSSYSASTKFALIFLDLDRFKYINDSMGHAAGDKVLTIIASILRHSIRENDFIARLGGDEFTILLPDLTNELDAIQVANNILNKTLPAIDFDGKQLFVTVSLGISIYPNDGKDSSQLIVNADTAMYKAKSRGRNRYVFYDKIIEEKNTSRIHIEEIIHRSLKNKNFFIQYQPKVNTKTLIIEGFEALVRIQDPELGIIYPNMFIEISEDLGLINRIDELVLNLVCKRIKHWQDEGLNIAPISVNLSPHQLKTHEVFETYMSIVNQVGIDPKWIQLEITENTLISNEEIALVVLNLFNNAGFTIALDDFGTGYSSLSCIDIYPIHTIKIDKSFIDDIIQSKSKVAIIKAIIQMAKDLDLNIIAEGVESYNQYQLLKELGCNEIQGYYFSKPVNPDIARDMLVKGNLTT